MQNQELQNKLNKLRSLGYNVCIPNGGDRISVMGYGTGYFKAKKQQSETIKEGLEFRGFNVTVIKDPDGYYDFWVK